jgi:hypothetical protein
MNAMRVGEHPLMANQSRLALLGNNGVPFTMQSGQTLAESGGDPVVGLVDYGTAGGQVLVLADEGILGFAGLEPSERDNFEFLRNLARYAFGRYTAGKNSMTSASLQNHHEKCPETCPMIP